MSDATPKKAKYRPVEARCDVCERPYGDCYGFPDLIIPNWAWNQISENRDRGGLLCPSCICMRLHENGIRCIGSFASGPIQSIDDTTMWTYRMIENMRDNEDDKGETA